MLVQTCSAEVEYHISEDTKLKQPETLYTAPSSLRIRPAMPKHALTIGPVLSTSPGSVCFSTSLSVFVIML